MTAGASHNIPAWPAPLRDLARQLPRHDRLCIAFSGGLDSSLLLHLFAAITPASVALSALHINHQLQPNAADVEAFCRDTCERLGVPLQVVAVTVPVKPEGAGGLEQAARAARYDVFEQQLRVGELLLLAHHGDDQLETVLFRLFRGTGVAGLAGMPFTRALGAGALARPLLQFSRAQLELWAEKAGLPWIEDPSNSDQRFDRNYLRGSVIPPLKIRWPSFMRRVETSARSCADSHTLNQKLAQLQWHACDGSFERNQPYSLDQRAFAELSPLEQGNLLRWWCQSCDLPAPVSADWQRTLAGLMDAAEDREPQLLGQGYSIRRFQHRLYLVAAQPPLPSGSLPVLPQQTLRWGEWTLALVEQSSEFDQGGKQQIGPPPIRVSTRQGGERIRFYVGGPAKVVKKWLQEQVVPPWERARLPMVFAGCGAAEELIAVGSLWCSEKYSGGAPASGWKLIVRRDCD
jgi:tRNA(Ile)-lysidine synthase